MSIVLVGKPSWFQVDEVPVSVILKHLFYYLGLAIFFSYFFLTYRHGLGVLNVLEVAEDVLTLTDVFIDVQQRP